MAHFSLHELKVVGVTGLMRSGKDSIAEVLVQDFGYMRLSHADALKEGCAAMLGRPLIDMYEGDREAVMPDWGFSIRHFLQVMGTECVRGHFRQDFWIVALTQRIAALSRDTGQSEFVIPDVRFEDEAKNVREHGGFVIHVERPGQVRGTHASEQGVAFVEGDATISNDGTLADLRAKVHAVMKGE